MQVMNMDSDFIRVDLRMKAVTEAAVPSKRKFGSIRQKNGEVTRKS